MRTLMKPFQDLIDYWHAMPRSVGIIPCKRDINPGRIAKIAPLMFVGERLSRYQLRVRLSGTVLDEVAGAAMTGVNLFDSYPPEERDFYADFLDNYSHQPCGAWLNRLVISTDQTVMNLETVAVPLADRNGKSKYIMGIGYGRRNRERSLELAAAHGRPVTTWRPHFIQAVEYIDLGFGTPPMPPHPPFGGVNGTALGGGQGE